MTIPTSPARRGLCGWRPGHRVALVLAGIGGTGVLLAQEPGAAAPAADPGPRNSAELPDNTGRLATAGAAAFAAGRWDEAVGHYRNLLALEPRNPLALANLGQSLYRLGRFDEAATALERAIALDSTQPLTSARISLGLIRQRQGRLYAAVAALGEAVDTAPDSAPAHQFLGVILHANGWNAAAQVELQRALQLDPGYATAHFNLAVTYLDERPPSIELARRHYYYSLDAGGARDEDFERRLASLAAERAQPRQETTPATFQPQ